VNASQLDASVQAESAGVVRRSTINADLAFDRRCGARSAVLAQWFDGRLHTGLLEAPAPLPDNTWVPTMLRALAIVLLLGGIGHAGGIAYFYATTGVPETNRVLLDLWVAEVHLLAGGLYFAASLRGLDGPATRLLAGFGALTVVGFATPMLPVLFARAPVVFRIPPLVYLAASLLVLVWLVRGRVVSLDSGAGERSRNRHAP